MVKLFRRQSKGPKPTIDNQTRKKAILTLIDQFNEQDFKAEGIFRVSADLEVQGQIIQAIDVNFHAPEQIRSDERLMSNTSLKAGVLKQLIRDLRDKGNAPIFSIELQNKLMDADAITDESVKLNQVKLLLSSPTEEEKKILVGILHLCTQIIAQSNTNRMTAQSLAIVLAPNLIDDRDDPFKAVNFKAIFQFIIESADSLKLNAPTSNRMADAQETLFSGLKKEIEEKEWKVGKLGGVTVETKQHGKKKMPRHVAELYKVCNEAKPETFEQDLIKANQIISNKDIPKDIFDWIISILKKLDFMNLFPKNPETENFYVKTQILFGQHEPKPASENPPPPYSDGCPI